MVNYSRLERPVQNDSAAIVVELGLTLLQIIDVVSLFCYKIVTGPPPPPTSIRKVHLKTPDGTFCLPYRS